MNTTDTELLKLKGELEGQEFDWFALDSEDNIGLMSTAGSGFIPDCVLQNHKEHLDISSEIPTPNVGSPDVWKDYASLGIWVFDWGFWGAEGPYELVAKPSGNSNLGTARAIKRIKDLPKIHTLFQDSKFITLDLLVATSS
jgi:hypothetical protein